MLGRRRILLGLCRRGPGPKEPAHRQTGTTFWTPSLSFPSLRLLPGLFFPAIPSVFSVHLFFDAVRRKVLIWNCWGLWLKGPEDRERKLARCASLMLFTDILSLQETHLAEREWDSFLGCFFHRRLAAWGNPTQRILYSLVSLTHAGTEWDWSYIEHDPGVILAITPLLPEDAGSKILKNCFSSCDLSLRGRQITASSALIQRASTNPPTAPQAYKDAEHRWIVAFGDLNAVGDGRDRFYPLGIFQSITSGTHGLLLPDVHHLELGASFVRQGGTYLGDASRWVAGEAMEFLGSG